MPQLVGRPQPARLGLQHPQHHERVLEQERLDLRIREVEAAQRAPRDHVGHGRLAEQRRDLAEEAAASSAPRAPGRRARPRPRRRRGRGGRRPCRRAGPPTPLAEGSPRASRAAPPRARSRPRSANSASRETLSIRSTSAVIAARPYCADLWKVAGLILPRRRIMAAPDPDRRRTEATHGNGGG